MLVWFRVALYTFPLCSRTWTFDAFRKNSSTGILPLTTTFFKSALFYFFTFGDSGEGERLFLWDFFLAERYLSADLSVWRCGGDRDSFLFFFFLPSSRTHMPLIAFLRCFGLGLFYSLFFRLSDLSLLLLLLGLFAFYSFLSFFVGFFFFKSSSWLEEEERY